MWHPVSGEALDRCMAITIAFLKFTLCWLDHLHSSHGNALWSNSAKVGLKLLGGVGGNGVMPTQGTLVHEALSHFLEH